MTYIAGVEWEKSSFQWLHFLSHSYSWVVLRSIFPNSVNSVSNSKLLNLLKGWDILCFCTMGCGTIIQVSEPIITQNRPWPRRQGIFPLWLIKWTNIYLYTLTNLDWNLEVFTRKFTTLGLNYRVKIAGSWSSIRC